MYLYVILTKLLHANIEFSPDVSGHEGSTKMIEIKKF